MYMYVNLVQRASEADYQSCSIEISDIYSASSLKSGFFSFLVKVANSAIISQVCVIES